MPNVYSLAGYPPYEQRYQMETRAVRMQLARPDWVGTVADAEFSYRLLYRAVPFGGDARPTDRTKGETR